jgi:pantetheine-phosphate adenylyltransferase
MRVCVGGTFNVIHDGHIALLKKAFSLGGELFVGLTSDMMATGKRAVPVQDYETREKNLTLALSRLSGGKRFSIFMIGDELGPAATEDFDMIVVSKDTEPGALRINKAREARGLRPLRIVRIPMVLARDGEPISSTRILRGQISAGGEMRG